MITRRLFVSGSAATAVTGVATRPAAAQTPPHTAADGRHRPIDRKAVVARHRVVRDAINTHSPLQVGNGRFAFGVDVTGLQTFVPFNTMSEWGWHSFPLPPGQQPSDFRGEVWDTHGRAVEYPIPNPAQPELSRWLYANPARINLGRIGLELTLPDGRTAVAGDLTSIRQELDLWTGIIDSHFELAGEPVHVRTCCHPDQDAVAVEIDSPLVAADRLAVFLDFPYADQQEFAEHVGTYGEPNAHQTTATTHGNGADITHRMDSTEYHVEVAWQGRGVFASADANGGELVIRKAQYGTDGRWADVAAKAGRTDRGRLAHRARRLPPPRRPGPRPGQAPGARLHLRRPRLRDRCQRQRNLLDRCRGQPASLPARRGRPNRSAALRLHVRPGCSVFFGSDFFSAGVAGSDLRGEPSQLAAVLAVRRRDRSVREQGPALA